MWLTCYVLSQGGDAREEDVDAGEELPAVVVLDQP